MGESNAELTQFVSAGARWRLFRLDARTLFVLIFLLALFVSAVRPTSDPDMWWHLRTGEVILEQGIPRQDVFSFTVSDHHWITHEWLSQLIMWMLYVAGGFDALILSFAAIIALAFWLVFRSCVGQPYLPVFVTLVAAFASAPTWGVRPQMFNLLFLASFLFITEGVRSKRYTTRAYLWFLPLSILWANLHSGFMIGVVFLAAVAIGDAVQLLLGARLPQSGSKQTTRQIGALGLSAAGSLMAGAINPNGFRLWLYPLETLSSPAMQGFILEWQSPELREYFFWPFVVLLLLGILGWTYGRRPSASDTLLFLGTGLAGLLSARNISLFAVVATPIVCRALWPAVVFVSHGYLEDSDRNGRRSVSGHMLFVNYVLLGLCMLAATIYVANTLAKNEQVIATRYPVAAVDFLFESGLEKARGYNEYAWGGYLIWRGIPVFVDGRADVYGDEFLFLYQQGRQLEPNWREPLDSFNVDYVLMDRNARLGTMLREVSGWREVYVDDLARVFLRKE